MHVFSDNPNRRRVIMKFKAGDGTEILDETGKQIIRLLPSGCSKVWLKSVTKLLLKTLNDNHYKGGKS